jgi:thiol-disulfide isomerase/thioredoxin
MMSRAVHISLFAAVALVALAAGFFLNPVTKPAEADVEAVFEARLPAIGGNLQPLGQWRGRVLVVNFWATWCPPCLEEIPEFVRLQARLQAKGLQFVGIAIDDVDKVRAFAQAHGINYPILVGDLQAMELARLAGNTRGGLPYTLVIDRQGRVGSQHYGGLTEATLAPIIEPLL